MPLVPLSADECDYLALLVRGGPPTFAIDAADLEMRLSGHAKMGREPLAPSAED